MSVASSQQSTGCVKFFGWLIGGSLALCAVIFLAGTIFPDAFGGRPTPTPRPETIRMTGTILLSPGNCQFEQEVRIIPRGGMPEILKRDGSDHVPGRSCNLSIDTIVEESSSYEIDVRGVGSETFPHSLIATIGPDGDTVLEVRLSW